jgi:hypothetical protein
VEDATNESGDGRVVALELSGDGPLKADQQLLVEHRGDAPCSSRAAR